MSDDKRGSPEVKDLRRKIDELQGKVKTIALPDKYIPNMAEHLKRFVPKCEHSDRVFKPNVTEDAVEKLCSLTMLKTIGSYVNDGYWCVCCS